MKCPKCEYLSFEATDRCRNCGYDFSLAVSQPAAADVRIDAADESLQPLDLALGNRAAPNALAAEPSIDLDRLIGAPARALPDLPLFAQDRDTDDDRPLITPRSAPRAPLAVRRNVDTARLRALKAREDPIELALELSEPPPAEPDGGDTAATIAWSPAEAAGWVRRAAAAAIDAMILAGIDAGVIYFTLQLCGLTVRDARVLPLVPLAAFLLMLNGGYLIAFVAMGGQTIGKMAAAIQVVRDHGPVDLAHAALRAAAYVVSLAPAGLGVVPAFFGEGRRTLHDRLADTRVVRA